MVIRDGNKAVGRYVRHYFDSSLGKDYRPKVSELGFEKGASIRHSLASLKLLAKVTHQHPWKHLPEEDKATRVS